MTHIERLQVETEGFLAGLNLRFQPGLNAIIGARGTGKTSIVELIRYALGAAAFSEEVSIRGNQQAIAILDGGAVTLTIVHDDERYTVTRSASGQTTRSAPGQLSCTVLAQNEIESVGAKASGRLHLIDRFRPDRTDTERQSNSLRLTLRSLTEEIAGVISEGRTLNESIAAMEEVADELQKASSFQRELLSDSSATLEQQAELERLQNAGQAIAVRESTLDGDAVAIERFRMNIQRLAHDVPDLLSDWPSAAGPDPLTASRSRLSDLRERLVGLERDLVDIQSDVRSGQADTEALRSAVDKQSRELRQRLENTTAGISRAARQVAELEERHGQLQAMRATRNARRDQYVRLAEDRDALFSRLDTRLGRVFEDRKAIVDRLNQELGPGLRIRITKSAEVTDYQSAIVAGLRGSGLHYNQLAPAIARQVSPLELTTWVEGPDVEALSSALNISDDRARAIVETLQASGAGEIISSIVEDGVEIELLDGAEYKPTGRLSIGQRCTAVLPLLLRQQGDPLIMDQPEDHLDNAFVASTLVPALRRRTGQDQFIVTTHNANIPVLGEAQHVIVMESDGERGFALHQGALDRPEIVGAVTSILEGGADAFARRAEFYRTGEPE